MVRAPRGGAGDRKQKTDSRDVLEGKMIEGDDRLGLRQERTENVQILQFSEWPGKPFSELSQNLVTRLSHKSGRGHSIADFNEKISTGECRITPALPRLLQNPC